MPPHHVFGSTPWRWWQNSRLVYLYTRILRISSSLFHWIHIINLLKSPYSHYLCIIVLHHITNYYLIWGYTSICISIQYGRLKWGWTSIILINALIFIHQKKSFIFNELNYTFINILKIFCNLKQLSIVPKSFIQWVYKLQRDRKKV